MLLDKLLSHLELRVEPFAVCDIRRGGRLQLAPPATVVLHFVVAGRGELRVPPRSRLPLAADHLVLVPPGLQHTIESEGKNRRVARADSSEIPVDSGIHRIEVGDGEDGLIVACGRVHASYGGLKGLFDRLRDPLVVDFSDAPAVRTAFDTLLAESTDPQPGGEAMVSALMHQCFVLLLRRLCEARDCRLPWLEAAFDEQLGRAVELMQQHPERSHSVEGLAAEAGLSRSSFAERFSRAFGRAPMDYLREVRLQRGARLLRTSDLGIQQVARRVGFRSRSHFSQAFAELFGQPPADYRVQA